MCEKKKRVLITHYHCHVDPQSGDAIHLRDLSETLAEHGWEVRVFCGPLRGREMSSDDLLDEQGIQFKKYSATNSDVPFELLMFRAFGVNCGLWAPQMPHSASESDVREAWLYSCRELIETWKPNHVIMHGLFAMSEPVMTMATQVGATRIACYDTSLSTSEDLYADADITLATSSSQRRRLHHGLSQNSLLLDPLLPVRRYSCDLNERRESFLTFVEPQTKGICIYAKIAEVLQYRRPDIPLLIVGDQNVPAYLESTGARLSTQRLTFLRQHTIPKEYLNETRLLLAPSVAGDTCNPIVSAAIANGIPVVGSNRGTLSEVIGEAGLSLNLPNQFTLESCELPSLAEISSWLEAIVLLWDDREARKQLGQSGQVRSRQWSVKPLLERLESL